MMPVAMAHARCRSVALVVILGAAPLAVGLQTGAQLGLRGLRARSPVCGQCRVLPEGRGFRPLRRAAAAARATAETPGFVPVEGPSDGPAVAPPPQQAEQKSRSHPWDKLLWLTLPDLPLVLVAFAALALAATGDASIPALQAAALNAALGFHGSGSAGDLRHAITSLAAAGAFTGAQRVTRATHATPSHAPAGTHVCRMRALVTIHAVLPSHFHRHPGVPLLGEWLAAGRTAATDSLPGACVCMSVCTHTHRGTVTTAAGLP